MYKIPVIKAFEAPSALNHLGIKPATSQKRRNRVKRTERGRQTLTPPFRTNQIAVDFGIHHSAPKGRSKYPPY